MRPKSVVSLWEVDESVQAHGEKFHHKRRRLGAAAGGKQIGCGHIEVAPGKTGWPAHTHLANEEAVYVLEGEGVLRLGNEESTIRAGDYIAFVAGGPAHRIDNRSAGILRYLAISTMIEPEVAVYPDSGKIGVLARGHGIISVHKRGDSVDYWEGEE